MQYNWELKMRYMKGFRAEFNVGNIAEKLSLNLCRTAGCPRKIVRLQEGTAHE